MAVFAEGFPVSRQRLSVNREPAQVPPALVLGARVGRGRPLSLAVQRGFPPSSHLSSCVWRKTAAALLLVQLEGTSPLPLNQRQSAEQHLSILSRGLGLAGAWHFGGFLNPSLANVLCKGFRFCQLLALCHYSRSVSQPGQGQEMFHLQHKTALGRVAGWQLGQQCCQPC